MNAKLKLFKVQVPTVFGLGLKKVKAKDLTDVVNRLPKSQQSKWICIWDDETGEELFNEDKQ